MDAGIAQQLGDPATVAADSIAAEVGCSVLPRGAPSISSVGGFIKRGEDIGLSVVLIVVLAWLLIGIAILIKVTSRGPVLFRQERRGRHGNTFRCFKFRTMYHHHADYDCVQQTLPNDPRITAVGRFLRRHSLDELPQLINVIVGDMALIGPRPHALGTNLNGRLLQDISPEYPQRYRIRPGITGWAQVNGWRGILDTEDKLNQRLAHDLYYIDHWSLWLDCKILVRTLTCLFDNER